MHKLITLIAICANTMAFVPSGVWTGSSARLGLASQYRLLKPARAPLSVRDQPFQPMHSGMTVLSSTGQDGDEPLGSLGLAATVVGLVANPVVLYSEYTLKTTGCGLPAGPGGALGALEGISYLAVVGIVAWSLIKKVTTGRGLPSGPAGLLGAVEGVSYVALLAGLLIGGLNIAEYGNLPEAVPVEGGRCSAI